MNNYKPLTSTETSLVEALWNYGAPGFRPEVDPSATIESAIAKALPLSRRSASLTEDLPVLFNLKKDAINLDLLEVEARSHGAGAVLGFFLTLTRDLVGRRNETEAERRLVDVKPKDMEMFFICSEGGLERELAARRSPPAALRWNYLMLTPMSAFQEVFNNATA